MLHFHHVPGRLRVRVPGIKRNEAVATQVRQRLADLPGVQNAETSCLTGSLVVNFNPRLTSHVQILASLREQGLLSSHGTLVNQASVEVKSAPARPARAPRVRATRVVTERRVHPVAGKLARKAVEMVIAHLLEMALKRSFALLLLALL